MSQLKIRILNKLEEVKEERCGKEGAFFTWSGIYEEGDVIEFLVPEVPNYYLVKVDDCIEESLVYITKNQIRYFVPFAEKKTALNPKSFFGDLHYLSIKPARKYQYESYRNLAVNTIDQHHMEGCYPHAYANVETRGESVFAAYNAIDGVIGNESHGEWPFQSWGINQQADAEITIEFGRATNIEEVCIYTRADFPHDNWWVQATLEFSDGSEVQVQLNKTKEAQRFPIKKSEIIWIKMKEMIKADDPSPFPALTQLEVYGNVLQTM